MDALFLLLTLSVLSTCAVVASGLRSCSHHHCFDGRISNRGSALRRKRAGNEPPTSTLTSRAAAYRRSPSFSSTKHSSPWVSLWNSASSSEFDEVSEDELEETILRMNFSYPSSSSSSSDDEDRGSLGLEAVREYTRSFPFAAVLPVQPLTYLPVTMSDGNPALKVTFLRKKTAEKGSADGGVLFSSCLASEEDCDEDGALDNYRKSIQLTARRITKGQTVSKIFSEKLMILAFVKGLGEERGKNILKKGGDVEVESVFHLWM